MAENNKLKFGLNYMDTGSFLHKLSGVTKFILFIAWITLILTTFDIRIIGMLLVLGFVLLKLSRVPTRIYRPFVFFMIYIVIMNSMFMFLFAPLQGVVYIGTETVLFHIAGRYTLTAETLFYLFVIACKHFSIFPMALVFVFTTHPTEFAASLNKIGVPFRVAYAVSLTLRYLPEITGDFVNIMHSQQARGVDISRKVSLVQRIKNVTRVLIPLIFSSLGKADIISNAMELRGFGKKEKRTWFSYRKLARGDFTVFACMLLFLVYYVFMKINLDTMFWYPF